MFTANGGSERSRASHRLTAASSWSSGTHSWAKPQAAAVGPVDPLGQHDVLPGPGHADLGDQARGSGPGERCTELDLRHPPLGGLGRDPKVARRREARATTDRVALHSGDGRQVAVLDRPRRPPAQLSPVTGLPVAASRFRPLPPVGSLRRTWGRARRVRRAGRRSRSSATGTGRRPLRSSADHGRSACLADSTRPAPPARPARSRFARSSWP